MLFSHLPVNFFDRKYALFIVFFFFRNGSLINLIQDNSQPVGHRGKKNSLGIIANSRETKKKKSVKEIRGELFAVCRIVLSIKKLPTDVLLILRHHRQFEKNFRLLLKVYAA